MQVVIKYFVILDPRVINWYFVVMPNRSHSENLGMYCIVMPSLFVNCPAVICLPNIASYLRETPLVICGPWSYLLHTVYKHLLQYSVTVPCNSYCFPHCAANPLFLQDRRDWQPLCFELGKVLVCAVQIPRCCRHHRQLGSYFPSTRGGVITNNLP